MSVAATDMRTRLIGGAADLIMRGGYKGFSYADLSERFGIRSPSIHHHFPSKTDLVTAAVEQSRAGIRAQDAMFDQAAPATEQLRAYTGYWDRCIRDQTAPFCLAAVLAAELPSLPPQVAEAVRGHFVDLSRWLQRILALGVEQGVFKLEASAAVEAEAFIAGVYGAMLAARAFDDPQRYSDIVELFVGRISRAS